MFTKGERVMVNLGPKSDVTSEPGGSLIITECVGFVRYETHVAGYGPAVSVRLELPGTVNEDGTTNPMRGPARMVKASMVKACHLPEVPYDFEPDDEDDEDEEPYNWESPQEDFAYGG